MDVAYPVTLFLVLGLVAVTICVRFVPDEERAPLARLLVGALMARLALAAVFAAIPETRMFHEDAMGYETAGHNLSQAWRGLRPPIQIITAMHQNYGWLYVCGAVDYLFGDFAALPSCFNCLVGTVVVFMVYQLARHFFHPLVARRAAVLAAFMPSMVLWSSVAIKDSLMAFLILVGLYSCVSIKRRFSVAAAFGICGSLIAMQPIRFYMIYFLGFAIVLSLFLERGMGLLSGVYKQLLVVGLFAVLLVMVGVAGRAQAGLEALDFAKVSSVRHGMAITPNSRFNADVDVSTPGRAIMFLPIGVSELLLSPFPWQITSLRALLAAPETLYWWLLFPSMIRGMWWMLRKRFGATSPLLLFAVTLTCAYSLVHGNVGSGFRQRAQIFIILFIFAALGVYRRKCLDARLDPNLLLIDEPR